MRRGVAINLRAKPEQRDLIDQAAAMLGKNRSDFMLEAACERALSEQARQFCAHYGFQASTLHPMTLMMRLPSA